VSSYIKNSNVDIEENVCENVNRATFIKKECKNESLLTAEYRR
jgi:hypothetical protein